MRRELSRKARTAAVATLACGALAAPTAAQAAPDNSPFTFAVIGDIPYGADKIAQFPRVVDQINADPQVQFVDHLGDIKSGSSPCTDAYNQMIRAQFDRFADPLVYTPGDNEWTDCHRTGANPLERLQAVRTTFFDRPGHTLGRQSVGLSSQAGQGLPENVSYQRAGVSFAALHVVGSDNSLLPWDGIGKTEPTPEQVAEEQHRTQAVIDLINRTFDQADGRRAVVLMMQADMFDPTFPHPDQANFGAFRPIVATIAQRAAEFEGPVYLLNGDSHLYNADHPLAAGSSWLSFYGVQHAADNLTRITVDGSGNASDYMRMHVDQRDPAVLTWERVPFVP
jgi:hypothetical protein